MAEVGLDRRGMAVVSSAHALADCCQAAVPALLPFLIAANGWGYATASALVLAGTVASSIVQPVFGLLADRRSLAWMMPAGIFLAALFVGLAAIAPSYELTFAAVVASGLGVAAFHPEGSRYANYLGTLAGGRLADRIGRRPVVIGSLTLASPLVLLFLAAPAALATPLLFVIGAAVISSFAVTVVMGQEYLPGRIGVASGVTLGLAIGLGGVGAPLLGLLADAQGLEAALLVAGLLPLIGVAATLTLPGDRRATARAAAG